MSVVDLTPSLAGAVRAATSADDLAERVDGLFTHWQAGVLGPLLSDMARLWGWRRRDWSVERLSALAEGLESLGAPARARDAVRRLAEITGAEPRAEIVLLAGLGGPEGYSRFDRGRNTIFIGLDHPSVDRHPDHLEIVLAHELVHSLRDPLPEVLADYGGFPSMTHDDFVERYSFAEHLVSEALATSLSELAYPGREEGAYTYLPAQEQDWCSAHREEIALRVVQALERDEPYRTFYAAGVVAPDAPECCDYYLALQLGRHALKSAPPEDLLRRPATAFLKQHLPGALEALLGRPIDLAPVVFRTGSSEPPPPDPRTAIDASALPAELASLHADLAAVVPSTQSQAIQEGLQAAVAEAGLTWAGEPHEVRASAFALAREELAYLRWAVEGFLRVVEKTIELYRADAEVRAFFGFPAHLEELALLEPGYRPFVPIARLDSYWNGRRLRLLELNANGAAGIPLAERLPTLFLERPELHDLLVRHGARVAPLRRRLSDALLEAWRQARGTERPELTAIVDWRGLASSAEQAELAAWLTGQGLRCVVVAPERLRRESGELRCPAGRIDLVYRRLTTLDLIERAGQLGPLLDATRAGEVVVFGSFASDVAHSKTLFAFLSHERWRSCFSPEERTLLDACVPWTATLRHERVLRGGGVHDLLELALAQRESLVVKPAEGYEGRGVLLGAECAPELWEAELRRRWGADQILQERVAAPVRLFPLPGQPERDGEALVVHLGEFVLGGHFAGLLVRASRELVLSPTSTEVALPAFHLGGGTRPAPSGTDG